jgi:sensor histidine kinase YesM
MSIFARSWLRYTLAWVPATLLYAALVAQQRDVTAIQGLTSGVVHMGVAAIMGVGVCWLSGRVPLPRKGYVHAIGFGVLQLLVAFVYSTLWLAALYGWLFLVAGRTTAEYVMQMAGLWQLFTGGIAYGLIAGISYLIRSQRHLRAQEVAAARAESLAAQAQLETVSAQLRAIRAQLNPHFLFNALHALGALVRHDARAAEEALDRLGDLLRYALDHGVGDLVRLRDEWTFTSNYLELERLRLGPRLRLETNLAEDALDAAVPPFLVQPLVENAIRHAIAASPEGGVLRVNAHRTGDLLHVEVSDDGPGAEYGVHERSGGLGLRALRQQLTTRYDGSATMAVETRPGGGFRVAITIPAGGVRAGT